jgi:UDP:flavonoid glycosyltransferase YjiC (YdhE family)
VPWAIETAQEIESFHPELVLADLPVPGSAIAAEAAGLPYVFPLTTVPVHRLLPGLPVPGMGTPPGEDEQAQRDEFRRIANEIALPWLNAARTLLGLTPDTDPWAWEDRAERVLILSSPAFDLRADSCPSNFVYAGSVRPADSSGVWENPWDAGDDRPLVVVSTTTTGLAGLWFSVFQAAAKNLVELGMRGLMTVGPLDPNTLPQHESLAYRSFVPHSAVLPSAAAMVSQCGHGTVIAALRHGVPLICVPVFADQYDIAARVVHHGAGITLSTMSPTDEFRNAIETVVRDKSYRQAARSLAEKLAPEDGVQRAADEIESVAASG